MNRASIIAIIILVIILLLRECDHSSSISRVRSQYNDTLTTYVDKNGVATATIQVIKEENHRKFLEIKSDKESIQALQSQVALYKKKLKDATFAQVDTYINSSGSTTITRVDTITVDSIKVVYPTYNSSKENEWVKWNVIASNDSINLDLKVINKFVISQVDKRDGWFKPKKTYVDFKNLNPYTETKELERFTVEKQKSKIVIGPLVGISLSGKPMIGIGVTYPLLRL